MVSRAHVDMLEHHGRVLHEGDRANEVHACGRKVRASWARARRPIGRLGKTLGTERQGLIGASTSRPGTKPPPRRLSRAPETRRPRRAPATRHLPRDCARRDRPAQARPESPPPQQRPARVASRGQHQRFGGKPQRHRSRCHLAAAFPSSASTAAAVSSIERRVTSINGQLCLAQSRREADTSSATDLLVDILVVVAMRLEAEQPVLPDLHDALGRGDIGRRPTDA